MVNGIGQQPVLGLAHQQVYMLRHDHVSVNPQGEAAARAFQYLDQQIVDSRGIEIGPPVVAGKGHEVRLCGLLKASEATRHGKRLQPRACCSSDI